MAGQPPRTTLASLPPLDKTSGDFAYLLDLDPYRISVDTFGVLETISGSERFELVSSLYGLGSLTCWFFLLISVIVSWTINPSCARKDSITNDFIAALSLPVVAVAHFFHQIYLQSEGQNSEAGMHNLFTSRKRANVRMVAAIEGPLTVCEDFIAWAAILYFVAARKGQVKRMSLVVAVCLLCLSTEVSLLRHWVPWESSLLVRPFFFHLIPVLVVLLCWYLLTVFVYLVEVVSGLLFHLTNTNQPEIESGKTLKWRMFWPGRFSSWMSGFSVIFASVGVFLIKYASEYPFYGMRSSNRFVPRSDVGTFDLDQVVAAIGGVVTLLFSLLEAFKERKKSKKRTQLRAQ